VAFAAVSTDLYLPAIPALVADLSATSSQGQLTLSTFMLGFALGQILYGHLSDYYGRRPLLFVGMAVYLVGTVGCIVAADIHLLIQSRLVQGLGAAAGPVLARAIVSDRFHGSDAARVMATIAGVMALVPAVAPVIGGWLAMFFQWRALFVALLGVWRLGETCTTIGVAKPRLSAVVTQFYWCLRRRNFTGYVICGASAFGAMFCYISLSSYIVIEMLGLSPAAFGYSFMLVVVGYIAGAMLARRKVALWGTGRFLRVAHAIGVAGALLLAGAMWVPALALPLVLAGAFLVFAMNGGALPVCQARAIAELPGRGGSASAVFGFFQVAVASLVGFLAGYFYSGSLLPVVVSIALCAALSIAGHALVDHNAPVAAGR